MLFKIWMERAVFNYYEQQHHAIGKNFTTSPEISQMFGELIAVFLIHYWEKMNCPAPIRLVELGPGRGSLMNDIFRVIEHSPLFLKACSIHLIEGSSYLRSMQKERLKRIQNIFHYDSWGALKGDGPLFIIANEFFDSLPIQPFVYQDGFFFACDNLLRPIRYTKTTLRNIGFSILEEKNISRWIREGQRIEICFLARALVEDIGKYLNKYDGLFLMIDYGYLKWPIGDTIQAIKNGRPTSIHESDVDISAHVDFGALYRILERNCYVWPIISQGDFLRVLGIDVLMKRYGQVKEAVRLTSSSAMGNLFKVLIATGSDIQPL